MKKTFITTMPDHIGAFLQASRCFARLGVNITRVSYNKAVDSNTLFIDATGSEKQLMMAQQELERIGYIQQNPKTPNIILIEFRLRDVPGAVTEVLELITSFDFNISYMSSQENASDYQLFKMGLFVENKEDIDRFVSKASQLCEVKIIDYNRSEKSFDNSIFYNSFVNSLIEESGISDTNKNELLVNTNLAMQILDEQGLSPYKTFDSISRFACLLSGSKGDAFVPRVTTHKISDNTEITIIEPPCGSNTAIIKSNGEYLFVDSGYAYYADEMKKLLHSLIPDFDSITKRILVTHADVDHCGLLYMFDEIIASKRTLECFEAESRMEDGFREKNPLHKPYIRICKALTEYMPPDTHKISTPFSEASFENSVLSYSGHLNFGELSFEVYEGKGGHLPGEIVLIDYDKKVAFTGDIYINLDGLTPEQREYNRYAPILMTSVDTDPALCSKQRTSFIQRLGLGSWQIFGAHGCKKDYNVEVKK